VRLIWPTNDPPFRLENTTNLTGAAWLATTPTPVVQGANNLVTNATSSTTQFYRLVNP
jgi:hypothetical protein